MGKYNVTAEQIAAARRVYYKEWRDKNPDKVRKANMKFIEKNPEYHKNYRQTHKRKSFNSSDYNAEYYKKNKDKISEQRKLKRLSKKDESYLTKLERQREKLTEEIKKNYEAIRKKEKANEELYNKLEALQKEIDLYKRSRK